MAKSFDILDIRFELIKDPNKHAACDFWEKLVDVIKENYPDRSVATYRHPSLFKKGVYGSAISFSAWKDLPVIGERVLSMHHREHIYLGAGRTIEIFDDRLFFPIRSEMEIFNQRSGLEYHLICQAHSH